MTIVAMISTLAVTAVLIGSFEGGEVTIGGVAASSITYNPDNNATGSWTTVLTASSVSDPWYARLEIGAGSFNGPVTITWQLQQKNGTDTWTDVSGASETTDLTLSGSAESVYASNDGTDATNRNWGSDVTEAGTYRVNVIVESA